MDYPVLIQKILPIPINFGGDINFFSCLRKYCLNQKTSSPAPKNLAQDLQSHSRRRKIWRHKSICRSQNKLTAIPVDSKTPRPFSCPSSGLRQETASSPIIGVEAHHSNNFKACQALYFVVARVFTTLFIISFQNNDS